MDNKVKKFAKIAEELSTLYEQKNKAYGDSFGSTYQKLGIISAVTRISDKYNRLCNLATNPDIDNLGESIEDTLRDMASYCIMTIMEFQTQNKVIETFDIKKGDSFVCVEDVIMNDDDSLVYKKGFVYTSEKDGCITDEDGDIDHRWDDVDYTSLYFVKIDLDNEKK
jgi:hypothetical protein